MLSDIDWKSLLAFAHAAPVLQETGNQVHVPLQLAIGEARVVKNRGWLFGVTRRRDLEIEMERRGRHGEVPGKVLGPVLQMPCFHWGRFNR